MEAESNRTDFNWREAIRTATPRQLAELLSFAMTDPGDSTDETTLHGRARAVIVAAKRLADLAASVPDAPTPEQAGDLADAIAAAGTDVDNAADRLAVALDRIAEPD